MKVLFLDRDGVINKDLNYVHKKEDFYFKYGIFKLLKKAIERKYEIIIITNQSGIGRGFYSEKDFWDLMSWVQKIFLKKKISIKKIYFCPHHPTHAIGEYKKVCKCRKPNSLLFEKAKKEFNIDMGKSVMIGDKETDLEAAQKAGVSKLILLNTVKMSENKTFIKAKSIMFILKNFKSFFK